jgi:GNAT acetyltransferase-like protein
MAERMFPDGTRIHVIGHPSGESEVILSHEGKRISRTVIIPMFMRIGDAVVRMDGIGGVETDEAFRNRGYMRKVMETCVEIMISGDGAISTLFGIQDFYPKFGYATAGPEPTVALPLPENPSEISPIPSGWKFRPLIPGDMPAVMRIYHETTRRATGALRRHEEADEPDWVKSFARTSLPATKIGIRAWDKMRRVFSPDTKDSCKVLVDPAGEIVAYAWEGMVENWWMFVRRDEFPNSFHLAEAMAMSPMAADVLISACCSWAMEAKPGADRVDLAIPPEGYVASAAFYEGGIVLEVNVRRGDFMCRTLNPARLIEQMQPEFTARIQASRVNVCGDIIFRTDMGDVAMDVTDEGVDTHRGMTSTDLTIEVPQDTLARLCLGAFETRDLLERLPNPPDRRTCDLMEVLFPRRHPHIYPLDRF